MGAVHTSSTTSVPEPLGALAHLLISVAVGAVAAGVTWLLAGSGPLATLLGFVGLYLTFTASGWLVLHGLDAVTTERVARRELLPSRVQEGLIVLITLGGVVAIQLALVLDDSHDARLGAALALLGVFGGWASLHLMYVTRYADLYYSSGTKAIDFNSDDPPTYSDFFYFSYNLGMTYQVSDTAVTDRSIRDVVLRHCLLSYVFGAVILASTVNLVAQIATG